MVRGKLSYCSIEVLHCADGSVTTNEEEVKSEIIGFYQNLLETEVTAGEGMLMP